MSQPLPPVPPYELIAELGRGTTGTVYKARDRRLDRVVALKTPLPTAKARRGEQAQRFRTEAQVLAYLTSEPGMAIPPIYEVGEHEGRLYHVREFVEGQTLERLVLKRSLGLRPAIAVLASVARVVQRVHDKGFVHHNLLPSNVLVGVDWTPWLIGFGRVSLLFGFERDPEEAAECGLSPITDLRRLSRILAWLCSRRRPVPNRLEWLCREDSFSSAAEFADELTRCPL